MSHFLPPHFSLSLPSFLLFLTFFPPSSHLLPFLLGYARDVNYLYAIPLEEIVARGERLTKQTLTKYQLPFSKHTSLFCTSPLNDKYLRLAVAVKTKVFMLAYKYPASMMLNGSLLAPSASSSAKENFIKHRVSCLC